MMDYNELERIATELTVLKNLIDEKEYEHLDSVHRYLCKQYIRRYNYLYKQGHLCTEYNSLDDSD